MQIDSHKRQVNILLSYLVIALILYFLYHIFAGKYGIISFSNSRNILSKKQNIIRNIENEIAIKKGKISKIKNGYIDADLLDEEIKKSLGHAGSNEIIIYNKDL